MRLVTSLLALAAAGAATAGPLPSQQDDSERVWLSAVPDNATFDCQGRISGYYADVDSGCQIYHMCGPQSRRYSYLCPAYTEFSQFYMTCVQHDRVNCSMSEKFFHMNEMIGQPRTRFHDLRQHDHSKKKDTEGSKAINSVDASEPAGRILFEFETKMDVSLKKRRRTGSRSRSRTVSSSQTGATSSPRPGAGPTKPGPTDAKSRPFTGEGPFPPPTASPGRLFKTLSPPQATTVATAPTAAQSLQSSRVTSSSRLIPHTGRGNRTTSTAYKARPRVRFSDLYGDVSTTPAPAKSRTTPRAPSSSSPISPPGVPVLPRNTYRTFGLPGSFSFGTLLNRKNKDVTPLPLRPVTTTQGTARRPTTAPPIRSRSTKAPSTRPGPTKDSSIWRRTTKAPHSRAGPTEATTSRTRPTIAPQTKSNLTTERPSTTTPRATENAPKTMKNVTTTVQPLKLKPRARLGSTATKAPKRVTNPGTASRASTESTTARSSTTQTTTRRPTTTPSTARRSTTRRRTTTSRRTTTKPATTRRTTRPTTSRPNTTKPTTTNPRTTTKSRRRGPSTSRSTTSSKPTTKSTTTKTTTARPTAPKRTTARRTTQTTAKSRRTTPTPKTTRRTTPTPTTARRTTPTQPATLPRSRVTQSVKDRRPATSSSTESPLAAFRPNTRARKLAATAPPVPSSLSKELPPIDELEALRLSFTLDPPWLEQKPDGPHKERNMKVRGELITGEMALRKLMVDQLKPVYFPDPSLPLNLLPPLLSEQSRPDGGQTTTLTLPVRRQTPDALLQAAAVAFNILPPELASLVPPMLTPPPPPLPSSGARNTTETPATSRAKIPATSSKQTPPRPALKPKKDRPGLTMKFGKKKTRFRVGDAHGSSHDACHPCMKSFIKDLDRCHPCVIIR